MTPLGPRGPPATPVSIPDVEGYAGGYFVQDWSYTQYSQRYC